MYFFKKLFTVSSNLNGIKEFNDVNQEQGWEGRGLGFFFAFFASVSVRMFRGRANCSDAFVDRTPQPLPHPPTPRAASGLHLDPRLGP